jgi:hypothetical protein
MINIGICLSDLPKSKITESKNGKKYINIVVDERREPDQYGNTHTVYISQSKEEREQKQDKVYIGNGKEFKFEKKPDSALNVPNPPNPIDNTDDTGDGLPY